MDELLQGPSNVARNDAAASDNDSDGMDVDSDLPKPSKGMHSSSNSVLHFNIILSKFA